MEPMQPIEKPKRGRPELTAGERPIRAQVTLDATTLERARDMGDGNLSQGIRRAVKKAWRPKK